MRGRLTCVVCLLGVGGAQVQTILRELAGRSGMEVGCAFVSYKDFGDRGDAAAGGTVREHVAWHGWAEAGDAAGMAGLQAFVAGLEASGGGDAEDAAGGLEAAGRLFAELGRPSVRLL